MSNNPCTLCGDKVTRTKPGLMCTGDCNGWYHTKCVKISQSTLTTIKSDQLEWKCDICKKQAKTSSIIIMNEDNIKSPFKGNIDLGNAVTSLQIDVKQILREMHESNVQMTEFRDTLRDIVKALTYETDRGDRLEKLVNTQTKQLKEANEERAQLRCIIEEMRYKFDNMEQEALAANLELQGVPIEIEPATALIKLCEHAGCAIAPADIVSARRLPVRPARSTAPDAQQPPPARAPTILVKMVSEQMKEKVIAACRAKRVQPLNACVLLPSPSSNPSRIFVNEELTKQRRSLLHETKKFAKEHSYKYVWVKKGQIMLKRDESSRVNYIKSANDFLKLENSAKLPE